MPQSFSVLKKDILRQFFLWINGNFIMYLNLAFDFFPFCYANSLVIFICHFPKTNEKKYLSIYKLYTKKYITLYIWIIYYLIIYIEISWNKIENFSFWWSWIKKQSAGFKTNFLRKMSFIYSIMLNFNNWSTLDIVKYEKKKTILFIRFEFQLKFLKLLKT